MTVTLDPLSIKPEQIGDVYDIGLGYRDPGTGLTRMVGYVLATSGTLTEGTNLQDEEHLVQIASPSSSDRYGRFPRVSQGDWSGGERQLIFENANAYYQSTQLNTTIPGHLTCNGVYFSVIVPNGVNPTTTPLVGPRTVVYNESRVYFLGFDGTTYWISVYNLNTSNVGTQAATSMGATSELMRNADHPAYVGAANGIWAVGGSGTTITITPQVTNDPVQVLNGASMATFQGSAYYLVSTMTSNEINSATYPLPGAGAGTTVYTTAQMEVLTQAITRGGSGLIFTTGRGNGIDQYVYDFDGVNANYLGLIEGNIFDICQANGTVYILTGAPPNNTNPPTPTLPIIYSIAGSTISFFDDWRKVDPDFWPTALGSGGGHIESDGAYLYLWWAGLSTKRYLLTTSAVMDVGNPIAVNGSSLGRAGTPLGGNGFVETEPATSATTAWFNYAESGPSADGILLTSWFDFDSPDVDKAFKAIEFTMNTPVDVTALNISFQTNSPANPLTDATVVVSPSGNTLVAYLPQGTLGRRIRFEITLNHIVDPDVQSYGITATLARVFQATVACNRQQHVRGGTTLDPQRLTSTELLANIQNCYTQAGGDVTMYIPDPTVDQAALDAGQLGAVALGVSMIQAQLQDYQRSLSPGVAPGYREVGGPQDLEATVALTLTEQLG